MTTTQKYYTVQQQVELDALLIKLIYAKNFNQNKVAYREELIREWKVTNGDRLISPYKNSSHTPTASEVAINRLNNLKKLIS